MSYKFWGSCLLSFALILSASAHSKSKVQKDLAASQDSSQSSSAHDSLVTVEWLKEHLDDPNLIILDTSVRIDFDEKGTMTTNSGRSDYDKGHIPTAGFADLTDDLVDTSSKYPYAIPEPEKFAEAMAALGVRDDTHVVLYAKDYSAWAARVWWMLRWIGFDNASILDGGLTAWTNAGFPLSTKPSNEKKAKLSISLRPNLIVGRDEVYNAITDKNVILIDAMPAAHYRGEMVMYGRAGHIPSAINIPTVFAKDGHLLSEEVLRKAHPFAKDGRIISYCGGGISASANAFAMHRLGFSDIGVYMNSLEEWTSNPENPLIKSNEPQ